MYLFDDELKFINSIKGNAIEVEQKITQEAKFRNIDTMFLRNEEDVCDKRIVYIKKNSVSYFNAFSSDVIKIIYDITGKNVANMSFFEIIKKAFENEGFSYIEMKTNKKTDYFYGTSGLLLLENLIYFPTVIKKIKCVLYVHKDISHLHMQKYRNQLKY